MSEKYEQEKKTQSFILVHSLFLEKLIQLSNPQPELDFRYESRIFTSNHNQSTIPASEKRLRHPPLGPSVNISLREPYS